MLENLKRIFNTYLFKSVKSSIENLEISYT